MSLLDYDGLDYHTGKFKTWVKKLLEGKANSSHTHTKSQITDFPTSMPASDVYSWAKASSKPSYTKSEVGLGNVDNTADSAKSVKYATSAGSASSASKATGIVDYGATDKTIQIGYSGNGISGDEIKQIAGYTTGDGSDVKAKIKDVSKDALKSWLGLGSLLPLSGGTMTGAIKTSGNGILNTSTDKSTNFSGGTDLSNGATLILKGKDQGGTDSNGTFEIHALTSKASSVLIGNPGGALDWSGTKICCKMLQLLNGNIITTDDNNAYGLKFTYFTNPILQIIPTKDNAVYLGHSSYRFYEFRASNIYTGSGTAVTSDKRYKNSISNLDDSLTSKFIMSLKPSSFKYNEGESGRTHYGLIAQDVEESMKNLGIDSTDFAGLVIEKLTKPVEVESIDENGKKVTQQQLEETGEIKYNLRYEEFIAPIIKTVQMQQKTIENLEERLSKLENKLSGNN